MKTRIHRRRHDDAHRPGRGAGARAFSSAGAARSTASAALEWPAALPRTWPNILRVAREQLDGLKANPGTSHLGSWDRLSIAVDRVRRMLQGRP